MPSPRPHRLYAVLLFSLITLLYCQPAHSQWRPDYLGTDSSDDINGMYFLSPSTGYVAFNKFVGFTQDSGRTFVHRQITISNVNYNGYSVGLTFGFTPMGVYAFSTDSLIAYGHFSFEPSILFSADQGQTWKLVFHQPLNPNAPVLSSGITDMEFPGNGSVGFAVHNEAVVRTTDRGQSWQMVLSAPNQQLRKLSFPSTATGYVAGGAIAYKATNTGLNWTTVTPTGFPYSPDLNNVFFTSPTNGYLTENGTETIYRTTDGAATWRLMNDPSLIPIKGNDLYFTNDSTGYVALGAYQVAKTTNYGKTWEPCKNSSNYQFLYYGLNALFFYGNQTGWTGGNGEYLMITTNGGPTLPKAYFKIDTTGLSRTDTVNLVNYSNTGYQYKWYRNDTLIGTNYNLPYAHALFRLRDTIRLVVSNGVDADSMVSYTGFPPPVLVYGFSPAGGASGSLITIKGTGFSGAGSVSFGGVPATSFTVVSDSVITATVGSGASGAVVVTTPNGRGSLAGFLFAGPPNTNLPVQVTDSILCKAEAVTLTIQNTEAGVTYTLVDSLGNGFGTVSGNGGSVSLISNPVSVTGHYSIKATRTSTGVSATFSNKLFLLIEHPHSAFTSDKLNAQTGEPVRFISRSTGAASYQWVFNQDPSLSNSTLPVVQGITYGTAGQKTLMLISTTANGCSDTLSGNAVFVYTAGSPSNACYADDIDHTDTIWPNLMYQTLNDFSPAPNDGFMICASGNQTVVDGRAGLSAKVPGSSSVYTNYSANGVLRWTDYVTQGSIGSSAVDANGNIYLTGICNSTSFFHFGNGDSMQIYVTAQEKDIHNIWAKNNGFVMKLDPNGNYIWHTILYDPSALWQGYPVQGGQGTKIRIFGRRVMVLGTFLANLSYVRNGVQTPLYALQNSTYANDLANNFILSIDTAGVLQWSGYTHNAGSVADVTMDGQGNAFITGNNQATMQFYDAGNGLTTFGGASGSEHGYAIKLDPTGHKVWSTHMDNSFNYRTLALNDVTADAAGNSYVIGNTLLSDTTQYFVVTNGDNTTKQVKLSGWFVGKFNSSGVLQWAQGNISGSGGTGYGVTLNGNDLYAVGSYINNTTTDYSVTVSSATGAVDSVKTTGTEMFVAKYATDGTLEQVNRSGGNVGGHLYGTSVFIDSHGNIALAGGTDYYNGGNYHFQFFGNDLAARASNAWFGKLNPTMCLSSKPVDAGADRTVCYGDSTTLGGNLSANDSVNWTSSPAGFQSRLPKPVVYPSQTTRYYVSRRNADSSVNIDSVLVTVRFPSKYAGVSDTICLHTADTLGIPGAGAVQYNWTSSPAGWISGMPQPVVSPIVTTSYYLHAVDSWGCASNDTVTVTVKPSTLPLLTSLDTAICSGQPITIGKPDSINSYSWTSAPAGFSSALSSPLVTPPSGTTVYYALITDPGGCQGRDTVTVHSRAIPAQPVVSLQGDSVLLSSVATGNQWYKDSILIPGAAGSTYRPTSDGLYTVRSSDSGCAGPLATPYSYTLPPPGLDAGPDRNICYGDSAILGSSLSAADSVYWTSSPAGFQSRLPQPVVYPGQTTRYFISRKNADGTVSMDSVLITVNQPHSYGSVSDTICLNMTDTLGIPDTTTLTYRWSASPAGWSSGLAQPVVSPKVTTSYYLQATDSRGCISRDTITVTVKPTSLAPLHALQMTICAGQSVVIGSKDSVNKWVWSSVPAGFHSTWPNALVTPTANTIYYALVTDPNGCTVRDTVSIMTKPQPPQPVITVQNDTLLLSSATTGNQWYKGSTPIAGESSPSYRLAAYGVYTVQVSDSGCYSAFAVPYIYSPAVNGTTPANDSVWANIGPNPFNSQFHLFFHIPGLTYATVNIIDLKGNIILIQPHTASGSIINLSDMQKGVYGLILADETGKIRMLRSILKL